ncbi:MAG: hypothetical protein IJA07_05745 [Agathobacter sp.]|nr:hypothetical protein [Agathobacter sp.]
MRGRALQKIKQNSAFTMMEMLITVAVLVVLLGISVIGISHLVSDLKMTELDRYAKTIYLEAQNQLTAKEVEGGMERYYQRYVEEYETRFLQVMPQDYDEEKNKDAWKHLCYVSKRDAISETLIATTTNIYQTAGDYVIELNPQTGDIYGVFYWEKEESISYTDIENLVDRSKEERTEMKIGYYGGAINNTMSSGVELDQRVELVNAEELILKVSYDASARLRRYYSSSLKIEYLISNEAGTATYSGQIDLNSVVDTGERLEFSLLLDSLNAGSEFKKITAGSGIKPGENISIVVKSTYEHGSDFCVESNEMEPVVGNSLYGNHTTGDTIKISNLRHFRNLDEDYVDESLYRREHGETLNVEITESIDFADNGYISQIAPIYNERILSNATVTGFVNDEVHVLKNFVVNGMSNNVGLFAETNNVDFVQVLIEDITVKGDGYSNVGAFVGNMTGGSLSGCGVYLTTSLDEDGTITYYSQKADETGNYKNEMEYRYNTRKITGQENVGGLIGVCNGTTIENCFAAIQVEAAGNVAGGFVGETTAGRIENAYASGDVTAAGAAGGFAGRGINATIVEAYSTGNVYGENAFGGFVGNSTRSFYQNCTSYGEVLKKGMTLLDGAAAGGFVYAGSSNNNTYSNCKYMNQSGFNKMGLSDPDVIGTGSYKTFLEDARENTLSVGSSFPYKNTLFQMAFPFAKLPNQTQHYGNWPAQYVIDTSLVYYEKYADGSYGYYGVTYITDDTHVWLLNTLKEESCIEDGYALLTKYNLDSFIYDLYVGSGESANISDATMQIVQVDNVLAGEDAEGKAIRLVQQGNIEFTAYTSHDTVTGEITGKTGESFLVNGMYLYQLPYDLQCTERYGITNFYDRFVIRDVKAKGSSQNVIDEMSFFYCPHFAKTAVNPNINSSEEVPNSIWDPQYVAVRSARQLNALGRYPYYWNARGGNDTEMYFIQETDINFSTYGIQPDGSKKYGGHEFDLTKFGTSYANEPIGQPDIDSTDNINYAQFSNSYDGQCHKIIDYCLDSSRQFVGLFGEIIDAEIKNIVMTISDAPTGNAGVINGRYHDLKSYGSGNRKRTGVGALIGLDYNGNNVIENCAAAGYTVQYTYNPLADTNVYRQPVGIAVGGLIGFGMSDIDSCSAVNDVRAIFNEEYNRSYKDGLDGAVLLGGFAGSYFYNTISNCYAGGSIDVDWNNHAVMRLRIGGFCPGAMDTPATNLSIGSGTVQYKNIYTYTEIDADIWHVGRGTYVDENGTQYTDGNYDDFQWYIPVVSRMVCTYSGDPYSGIFGITGGGWTTDRRDSSTNVSVPGFSYYLTEQQQHHFDQLNALVSSGDRDTIQAYYFGSQSSDHPKTCRETDYNTLANIEGLANGITVFGRATNVAYPFPAFVKNGEGAYVHYGDWPVEEQCVVGSYPVYFEKYGTDDFGIYYLNEDGTVVDTLVKDDSKEIIQTGYGNMTVDASQKYDALFTQQIVDRETNVSHTYYVVEFSRDDLYAAAGTTSAISGNTRFVMLPYTYETVLVANGEVLSVESSVLKELYINPNFAAAISLENGVLGTEGQPLQVRTPEQFASVGMIVGSDICMAQTHSLDLAAGHTPITVNYSHVYDGRADDGFVIRNAINTIFDTNTGTILNTTVVDSVIDTQNNAAVFVNTNTGTIAGATVEHAQLKTTATGAGFVYTNSGNIQNASVVSKDTYEDTQISGYRAFGFVVENTGVISKSLVVGTITGVSEAAGFAAQNGGYIHHAYANTRVSGIAAMVQASGFVLRNSSLADSLKYCYASGSVSGYTAYGFMEFGKASWCYTVCQLNGAQMYGFAGEDAETDACYWGYDEKAEYNTTVDSEIGNGLPIELCRLMRGDAGADYDGDVNPDLPFSEKLGAKYPYPSVGLVHIGDWQPPSVEKQNEVVDAQTLNDRWKEAGIFYYERYLDGSYGVYLIGATRFNQDNAEVLVNTLAAADEPVLASGYGVFYQDTRWEIDIWGDWLQAQPITNFEGNVLEDFEVDGVEDAYHFRYITQREVQDYFRCTFTYSNQEKTMVINPNNFDRPE